MKKRKILRNLAFSAICFVFFFAVLEGALCISGFEVPSQEVAVYVDGQLQSGSLSREDESMWLPKPGKGNFNEMGFVGDIIPVERRPGVFRIALMGDSCTECGSPPYSKLLQDKLTKELGKPVELLNAGVLGYTSYQGIRRLEKDVLKYQPDIVTFYFGWNDHWMWQVMTDEELYRRQNLAMARLLSTIRESKVVQGIDLVVDYAAKSIRKKESETFVFRVPLDQYERNLRTMIQSARNAGAKVVLVTAPTDTTEQTPATDFALLRDLKTSPYRTPKELHDAYVQRTRSLAKELNCQLIEAYDDFSGRQGLMLRDHIHLTPAGIERMAELFFQELVGPAKSLQKDE